MNTLKFAKKLAIPLFVALAYGPSQGLAQSAQSILGANLSTFAVLGATSVTNAYPTATSTIVGNVGVSTGTSITGFGTSTPLAAHSNSQVTSGQVHETDALANSAHAQLLTAYGALGGLAFTTDLSATPALGGLTLTSGVYKFGVAAGLAASTTLTLDANNDPNAFWVFQVGTLLTVGALSQVVFLDAVGNKAPVFWQVGDATLAAGADFIGNIVSFGQVTLAAGVDIECGSALAYTANVTLIGNRITTGCNNLGFTVVPGLGNDIPAVTLVPEPETYAMLLAGLGLMGFVARRRQRNLAAAA